jgi:hypothetical protein
MTMEKSFKLAALVEEYHLGSPAQQMVDRFLLGMPRDGEFRPPQSGSVTLFLPASIDVKEVTRGMDLALEFERDIAKAVADADGVLVVPKGSGHVASERLLETALRDSREQTTRIFCHGILGNSLESAKRFVELASSRNLSMLSSSYMPTTWRLPSVDVKYGSELESALMVVVGEPREAEFRGIDGLLPLVERRRGGETGIRQVKAISGNAIWKNRDVMKSINDLLAAAISRSDTPQGESVKDCRTQDLIRRGLVPQLAEDPILYIIEHLDGLRSYIIVLNGVVGEPNFAVRTRSGDMISAQFYLPPPPGSHYWSALCGVVDDFFESGKVPSPVQRSVLASGLLEALKKARLQPGVAVETPDLGIAYTAPVDSAFRTE